MSRLQAFHGRWRRPRDVRGFTLIELLVVMGIVAVLGVLTALGYRGIAKDAKLSSAKNTIMAVLDNARGLAMKNNQIVAVVFRARFEGTKNQYIEAITARYRGHTAKLTVTGPTGGTKIVDRFTPIPNVPGRALPTGIMIASPYFAGGDQSGNGGPLNTDDIWITASNLLTINQQTGGGEIPGEVIGVMYAPDGTTLQHNPTNDSNRMWVDFDNDGKQRINSQFIDYFQIPPPTFSDALFNGTYFEQKYEHDEPYINLAPYVAVFNDDAAREQYDVNQWNTTFNPSAFAKRQGDYTQYITSKADRIHFNRYTGVAMK